jgi:hypothetical protein
LPDAGAPANDAGMKDGGPGDAGVPDAGVPDAGAPDSGVTDAGAPDAGATTDTLADNRNRLLRSYFAFLQSDPTVTQTNGLMGGSLTSVCDLWSKLDASSRAVFLTLTHRMQGGTLRSDGTSMLLHVVKLYRVAGGQNAQTAPPGSCGGGEYNRMIMSMDPALQAALVAANANKGAGPDISDIATHTDDFWRDSHDLAGPHAPFDLSDETDPGAPRGQVQFFASPTSAKATSPLGRQDLSTLVDPYALEMDQDYDCVHNSNPSCTYVLYGPSCGPLPSLPGTQIYAMDYGDFDQAWMPDPCN